MEGGLFNIKRETMVRRKWPQKDIHIDSRKDVRKQDLTKLGSSAQHGNGYLARQIVVCQRIKVVAHCLALEPEHKSSIGLTVDIETEDKKEGKRTYNSVENESLSSVLAVVFKRLLHILTVLGIRKVHLDLVPDETTSDAICKRSETKSIIRRDLKRN